MTRTNAKQGNFVRTMMHGKIHRATVTDANLNYVGSISIDPALLEAADILANELVHVLNITNGNRFETYAIEGGPGEICINGAAAHLASIGDLVIVVSYVQIADADARDHVPHVVHVDAQNRLIQQVGVA
jgi:aspartate 1-decarboxylase